MKKLTIIALFATLGFASCKDTKAEATTTETTTQTTETTDAPVQADSHEGHDHSHEGHNHGPEGHTAASATQAAGMNPPHGQPGHRCDIPVGAPLDSPPQRQVPAQAAPSSNGQGFLGGGNTQQAAPQQPQAMPAQETAPGMKGKPNPAHGQPGHRCDVSVGQPLP